MTDRYPWDDVDEDEGSEVEPGRRVAPFTYVHDWVTLSHVSARAKSLYTILRMYVFDKTGKRTCGPRQADLALMMGLSHADKVRPYLKELVSLGAVDVTRWGVPAKNKYTVHEAPPAGYAGPMTIKEWKEARADERALARARAQAANQVKRDRMRTKTAKKQVAPEPPPAEVLEPTSPEVLLIQEVPLQEVPLQEGVGSAPTDTQPLITETKKIRSGRIPRPLTRDTTHFSKKVAVPLTRQDQDSAELRL